MEHLLSTFERWLNDLIDERSRLTLPIFIKSTDLNDAVDDHENRLNELDAWQEAFTADTDVKYQIKHAVDEALRSIANEGRIKIYIDPEK